MLQTFTLKNGLKVATYSIPQMRSVYLDITIKGGSLLDDKGKDGVGHFMEHLLVQGTPSYPTIEELTDYLETLAGSYNALTSVQNIWFWLSLPAKYTDDALRIASEVFFQPLFPEEAIERERKAILTEYRGRVDSLGYKLGKFFKDHRYKNTHPLGRDILGTEATIQDLKKTDLKQYWAKFFQPNNTYLVIVGGFDASTIKDSVESWFAKFPKGLEFKSYPNMGKELLTEDKVFINHDPELKSCYVELTFPSAPGDLPGLLHLPQIMIRAILGGMSSSRLYRLLRQKRGLVYHVSFSTTAIQSFGLAGPSFECIKENLDETLELTIQELKAFIKTGPTVEELKNAKNYRVNKILMEFDHPSNIAGWIKDDLMWEDRIYLPEEWAKEVEKVDSKAMMEFMEKYWDLSKINLTIQGPIENSKSNIKKYSDMIKVLN